MYCRPMETFFLSEWRHWLTRKWKYHCLATGKRVRSWRNRLYLHRAKQCTAAEEASATLKKKAHLINKIFSTLYLAVRQPFPRINHHSFQSHQILLTNRWIDRAEHMSLWKTEQITLSWEVTFGGCMNWKKIPCDYFWLMLHLLLFGYSPIFQIIVHS